MAMDMVSAGGFRGTFSFKKLFAGGRLCILQEYTPHFYDDQS